MSKKIKQKSIIYLMFFLGIIISIHMKSLNPNNTFVTLKSIKEMENQINLERVELENINKLILERKSDIAKYELELNENGSISSILEKELKDIKTITGFEDVKGEGVIVELRDSERELGEGEDPNDYLVHDMDVLIIVNDLKVAGAEAISINGERVTALSEIKCSGPTITINGSTYGQPFVIKAIGNKKMLQASIQAQNSHAYLLKEIYGIDVQLRLMDKIIIPKYYKKINLEYIKEGD
ncbi:DUF881 domain-containing protein [Tepidibacter formicigenes]|jgi:uncharacterized protein YlxW (UPF0749 family)|uniref:Uncharacterized conserved protein YlxW, UPF0749 family n=1 Tax=Tepidibacter formicigenes DSM 15518 TaxID=1123349 RepID=A0A1M6KCC6_9FIRM|nr:DUF881 domain-containing protein [Tepidibacter formicigenes]SHJ56623.1 Uncharacterized conserved protein YlxW, UPF0749 family [Tepidibacter formicigenes DSM 15518]